MNDDIKLAIDNIQNVIAWINRLPIPTTGATAKMMRLESACIILSKVNKKEDAKQFNTVPDAIRKSDDFLDGMNCS
jgi:hypothetical protein